MLYEHDPGQAKQLATETLKKVAEYGLMPTPDAYAVWYAYLSEGDLNIIRAVDIVLEKEKKFTQDRCWEIYERYLGGGNNEDLMQKTNDMMSATLADMNSMMESVQSATNTYSGSLEEANSVAEKGSPEDIQKFIGNMLEETKRIMEENKNLESKLNQSSVSMKKLKTEIESVKKEATTDALTGLPNRKKFDMEIDRLCSVAKESDENNLILMMMDIDHFKSFNDTYGHQVGDQVLRLVGRTLQQGIKGADFAARYGGEEFSVMLPNTPVDAAFKVAESLRLAVAKKEVINRTTGEKLGKITMSIGLAELKDHETVAEVIERADKFLYKAKESGRNNVQIAE